MLQIENEIDNVNELEKLSPLSIIDVKKFPGDSNEEGDYKIKFLIAFKDVH
jgi:hypothetical protein